MAPDFKSIASSIICIVTIFAGSTASQADDLSKQAQLLLGNMNYGVGAADGQWGRRSEAAMQSFAAKEGYDYVAPVDPEDLTFLETTAPKYEMVVTRPGALIPDATAESCNALGNDWPAVATSSLPPFRAFDDSASIGNSDKKDEMEAWSRAVTTAAGWAATHPEDVRHFDQAKDLLLTWAKFGAGLDTPIDSRYLGHGNGTAYNAEAAAPVLDMENATRLGAAALYASSMLKDRLSSEDRAVISQWGTALLDKYLPGLTGGVLRGEPLVGIFYNLAGPVVNAIAEGDSDSYANYLKVYFEAFRRSTQADGAILKNANRGDRAIHYQSIGILTMAQIFDLAESQGTKIPGDAEDAMHRAVTFLLDADRDNSVILPYAKVRFDNPGDPALPTRFYRNNSGHYWWMVWYLAHYPETENAKRLRVFLADYDTGERVSSRVMASTFVPYPVNCFQDFDMSAASVSAARAFVAEHLPAVVPVSNPVKGRGFGKPKVSGSAPVTFDSASVTQGSNFGSALGFNVTLTNVEVGDENKPRLFFKVQGDFSGPVDQIANLTLLRFRLERNTLFGPGSREANYAPCGGVATEVKGSYQEIRLHIGEHSEANACIFEKMDKIDRLFWGSILVSFDQILKAAVDTPKRAELQQLYDFEVH